MLSICSIFQSNIQNIYKLQIVADIKGKLFEPFMKIHEANRERWDVDSFKQRDRWNCYFWPALGQLGVQG